MNINTKRLLKDIKELRDKPIDNIYYIENEENIYLGYSMIIGPINTPYENGFYFFDFIFPENYPFSPPKVIFKNYDGVTRFNPNFYINGRVCLSILNTWPGDKWSACQSLKSILLVLSTVLNDKPLLNEPNIYQSHKDFTNYNNIIKFKNYEICILKYLDSNNLEEKYKEFHPIICKFFKKNYNEIIEKIKDYNDPFIIKTSIYDMNITINYKKIYNLLKIFYNEMNKIDL